MENLRYPNGRFQYKPYGATERKEYIDALRRLPGRLRSLVESLSDSELEQPYRPGGWTARQVIHHMADSHINAFIRMKLILTEDTPNIKPYKEGAWAELPDTKNTPVLASVNLLAGLHERMVQLLSAVPEPSWQRTGFHLEHKREISLAEFLALYAWHSNHHLAHLHLVAKTPEA